MPRLHQIAGLFNFGEDWPGHQQKRKSNAKHLIFLLFFATPLWADRITADDFPAINPDQAKLGQLLFYDKILSGNRNISCGTCHHHDHHGTDGLSLGIGEGGAGVGPDRAPGTGADAIRKRIPRNAPALWNLAHKDVRVMFHDGRLSISDIYQNGFNSPAEEWLPQGLDNLLVAQALFPLTAQFEMAGNSKENDVAGAIHDRIDAAWPIIAKRVRVIPEYGDMFVAAFDHIDSPDQVAIVEVGNALGAFIGSEWQSYDSPYDDWLTGTPLPDAAERGRQLFFGRAGCASCHSGPLFTDQDFYALGLPAFGPGRTRRFDPYARDVGRMGESDALEDAYRFRTPSLRNVALTAPYGHNGAYPTLESMIRHHADPVGSRAAWRPEMAALPDVPWLSEIDFVIQSDTREMARQSTALDITPIALTDAEVDDLVAFLNALTGKTAEARPLGRPDSVPSGLPVD
ncbi:cytochrome-c peroxidase [Pseudaestuariivita rosea]|uniref:cytochrome-c peroxidase n=1 Tax=Pseudaestuariivita rosea TaxID=2763263 RepID=UPI001ABA477E|nr:cytochrome c peroxidase [Pseudaestuariivita rosea]